MSQTSTQHKIDAYDRLDPHLGEITQAMSRRVEDIQSSPYSTAYAIDNAVAAFMALSYAMKDAKHPIDTFAPRYSPRTFTLWDGRIILTVGHMGLTASVLIGKARLMFGVERVDAAPWVNLGAHVDVHMEVGVELNATLPVSKAEFFLHASWGAF